MFVAMGYKFRFHHVNVNGAKGLLGWPKDTSAMTHCNIVDDTPESFTYGQVVSRGVVFTPCLDRKANRKLALADAMRIASWSKFTRTHVWTAYFNEMGVSYD